MSDCAASAPRSRTNHENAGGQSTVFVLALDVPLKVVFHAPDALTQSSYHATTPTTDIAVAPINSSPSRSARRARQRRVNAVTCRNRHCDVMSRDPPTPEVVGRVAEGRGCRSSQQVDSVTRRECVGRHELLSRPRSQSVCAGKYCTASRLQLPDVLPTERRPAQTRRTTGRPRSTLRPRSAINRPHLPPLPTAATNRLHVARQPVPNDVTVNDNDDTATTASSSALGDSGVTSLAHDDVIASRDTSPWSDGSVWRADERGTMQRMTDIDRQSQLRRFLDAHGRTSSVEPSEHQHQQPTSAPHSDVTDDDTTDSETSSSSLSSGWQDSDFTTSPLKSDSWQSTSAMDQVRHFVARCRIPVHTCTHTCSTRDTWMCTTSHRSAHRSTASSMTSESIQRAVLGAAADLVSHNTI